MEGRKRKRGEHLTACQECHRLHRSCDGGRPCRRCVSTGKGATCQSLQRKPYTRKRRLSDQMGNQHVFSVFQCQSSNNAQPCANTNSQIEGDNQQILTELLQQVKQVQEITQSLQLRQQVLTKQLISLQPSSVINGIRHDPFSFGLLDDYPSTSESSPNNSSPPSFVDSPIQFFNVDQLTQPTELASNMHREMRDLVKVSHDPIQDLAFSVSNDTVDFQQSLFVPFAISDAAKVPAFLIHQSFLTLQILSHFMCSSSRSMIGSSSCKILPQLMSLKISITIGPVLFPLPFCQLIYPSARWPNIKRYSTSSLLATFYILLFYCFLLFISFYYLFVLLW